MNTHNGKTFGNQEKGRGGTFGRTKHYKKTFSEGISADVIDLVQWFSTAMPSKLNMSLRCQAADSI